MACGAALQQTFAPFRGRGRRLLLAGYALEHDLPLSVLKP